MIPINLYRKNFDSVKKKIMVALNFQIWLPLLMMNRCRFQDVYGVSIGGVVGHSMCTGLAVIGGRIIAQKISVRTGKHKLKKKKRIIAISPD